MIFIGDIACPEERVSAFEECIKEIPTFQNETVVLNFEANILNDEDVRKPLTLWNSPKVTDAFSGAKRVIVSLANNHAYDYPEHILRTAEILKGKGVGVFGLCNEDGSVTPYEFADETGVRHAFFGHCWRLYTKTNPNKVNGVRIVDHPYDEFVDIVKHYIADNSGTKVYCMMHWNYDLEHLPFPMHRRVARMLIDAGVEAVVGSHSHRPQGAEVYKGKPIVYGLGNFYLPSGIYFDGKLSYPICSHETYALRMDGKGQKIVWFDTDTTIPILPKGEESIEAGERIKKLSPFTSMPDDGYVSYFTKNRLKRTLVPVFDELGGVIPKLKENWAIARVRIIRSIKKMQKR